MTKNLTRIVIIISLCITLYIITNYLFHSRLENFKAVQTQHQHNYNQSIARLKENTKQYQHRSHIDPEHLEEKLYKLHELYYSGIPDKYDQLGNKIQGIAPDPKKAIFYLRKAIAVNNNSTLWLRIAHIYRNGMYGLEPDLELAATLYYDVTQYFPYTEDGYLAYDSYIDTLKEINNIKTYKWLGIHYKPKKSQYHDKIMNLFFYNNGTVVPHVGGPTTAGDKLFRVKNRAKERVEERYNTDDIRANDMHNTHNSQVVSTVANSIRRLKEDTEIKTDPPETIRQIRDYLRAQPSCEKREDAFKSLDSIERNILPITSVGMRESEVLNLVWNRIKTRHKESTNDLKQILYDQLADMQEHGRSVCSTGRLERIVDTLNTFDDKVEIKPTYAVNQEMLNRASAIREQAYNDAGHLAESYKSGTATDQVEFDNKLKQQILSDLSKEYVENGILTEAKFKTLTDKWINEI